MVGLWLYLAQLYHLFRRAVGLHPNPYNIATLIPETDEERRKLWKKITQPVLDLYYFDVYSRDQGLLNKAAKNQLTLRNFAPDRRLCEIRLCIGLSTRNKLWDLRESYFGVAPEGYQLLEESAQEHFAWLETGDKADLLFGELPTLPPRRSRLWDGRSPRSIFQRL